MITHSIYLLVIAVLWALNVVQAKQYIERDNVTLSRADWKTFIPFWWIVPFFTWLETKAWVPSRE